MGSVKTPKSPESENSYSESLKGTDGDGMPVFISLSSSGRTCLHFGDEEGEVSMR